MVLPITGNFNIDSSELIVCEARGVKEVKGEINKISFMSVLFVSEDGEQYYIHVEDVVAIVTQGEEDYLYYIDREGHSAQERKFVPNTQVCSFSNSDKILKIFGDFIFVLTNDYNFWIQANIKFLTRKNPL